MDNTMPKKQIEDVEIVVKPKRKYTKRKKKESRVIEIDSNSSELSIKNEIKIKKVSEPIEIISKTKNITFEPEIMNEVDEKEEFPIPIEVGEFRKTMLLSQFCVCLSYNEDSEKMTVKCVGTRERCDRKMEKYKVKSSGDIYFVLKCGEFASFC
jgi:hypothetical protein